MESWRRHIEEPRGHHANDGTLNNFGPSPATLCLHTEQNSQQLSVNNRIYNKHVCRWSVTHIWSYWIRVQHLQQLVDGVVSSWTGNCADSNCCLTGTTLFLKNPLCNTNQMLMEGKRSSLWSSISGRRFGSDGTTGACVMRVARDSSSLILGDSHHYATLSKSHVRTHFLTANTFSAKRGMRSQ